MPHPPDRKPRTRRRILQAAAQLFRAQGFEATRIEDVMHACSLTRGGFYAHFASKAALYREALGALAQAAPGELPADPWTALFEELGVPEAPAAAWALLAHDIARPEAEVRAGYALALQAACAQLHAVPGAGTGTAAVLAAVATVVGTIGIAATLDDPARRAQLLQACAQGVRQLVPRAASRPAPEPASDRLPDHVPVHPAFFWAPEPPAVRPH